MGDRRRRQPSLRDPLPVGGRAVGAFVCDFLLASYRTPVVFAACEEVLLLHGGCRRALAVEYTWRELVDGLRGESEARRLAWTIWPGPWVSCYWT